jgi:1-acyl-sn-glycerol-3-phosphate acyltransferase
VETAAEAKPSTAEDAAQEILAQVRGLVAELQAGRRGLERVTLDSSLERELALDSLGRAELLARLERSFHVRLTGQVLAVAETPRDLLRAVAAATGSGELAEAATLVVEEQEAGEPAPASAASLQEVLAWHARRSPERRHITYYGESGAVLGGLGALESLTYGELERRGRSVAAGLREMGIEPGRAVGLMLPTGLDYFAAFCGVLLAGAVPVPLYPPARRSQIEDHLRRQAGILATAEAAALITFSEVLPLARLLRGQLPALRRVVTVDEVAASPPESELPAVQGSDIAFLQFTSGSTGQPKGVVLTHANLLANLRAIGQTVEIGSGDVVVSWLPLYHDMGLIGAWMASLYYAVPLVLMSPLAFLARPARWLQAISRHRGTLSAAPNFAYELCAAKIDDADLAGVDLSSWRYALNGAEPVSPEAIDRFSRRFSRWGFRPQAMAPVYGLAESSLAVAFPPLGRGPVIDEVLREPLTRSGKAVPAAGDPGALRFAGCGFPLPGHEVRIVDAAGREVGERQEGELEFRGPSATAGYFRNPEATARLLRGEGWLDSGDRAYTAGGELFLTGRVKDIIIRGGRNLYPQELEAAVGEVDGVRRGCVAAFGSPDRASGTERLVIVAESRLAGRRGGRAEGSPAGRLAAEQRERLREAVQAAAVELLGAPADEVVLAPPHSVPKTSSGKIRRAACRELFLSGKLCRGSVWLPWQLGRLAAAGWRTRLARAAGATAAVLYNAYVWLLCALAAVPVWCGVVLAPTLPRRRRLARGAARLLLRLAGIPVRIEGKARGGVRIFAANHASYLDGIVLTAALPTDSSYVVKRELEKNVFSRLLLGRLGALFVERFEAAQGTAETQKAATAVARGQSLVIFPEGTFRRGAGLRPFRMGAFLVAAEAGVAVVPVALSGSRSVLRDLFFRRGEVRVTVLPAVAPDGGDWAAAVRLRDAVRAAILPHCGEPALRPDEAAP